MYIYHMNTALWDFPYFKLWIHWIWWILTKKIYCLESIQIKHTNPVSSVQNTCNQMNNLQRILLRNIWIKMKTRSTRNLVNMMSSKKLKWAHVLAAEMYREQYSPQGHWSPLHVSDWLQCYFLWFYFSS